MVPHLKFVLLLYRRENEHKKNFVILIETSVIHFFLFVTEVLLAVNLDLGGQLSWSAIFTPLYVLIFISLPGCILSCCVRKCNVEVSSLPHLLLSLLCTVLVQLEVLGFINLLQLIFLGIRLDEAVMWRWAVSCLLVIIF